jgi:hypothetical protein
VFVEGISPRLLLKSGTFSRRVPDVNLFMDLDTVTKGGFKELDGFFLQDLGFEFFFGRFGFPKELVVFRI